MLIESRACSFFLARLEAEVARLRDIAFPGHHTGPRKWLNFIAGILETARGYLLIAASAGTPAPEASKLVQVAEQLGERAYDYLRHVAGADATQIPHQVVAPFQRWVDRLQIRNTIFFRAEHISNYELWTFDARTYAALPHASASLLDAVNTIQWPVLRVTVPGQAMGMLPHFAVVAHELGHAIQERIRPDLAAHTQSSDECYARIQARVTAAGLPFSVDQKVRVAQIVESWIDELKADAAGHVLVGPAFFFALCGYLELAGQQYGISPTHPPSDLRRELLIRELSAGILSFSDVISAKTTLQLHASVNSSHVRVCPAADVLFSELSTAYDIVDAAICVELVAYIRSIGPTIFSAVHSYIQRECPDLVYAPSQLKFDLDNHLEPLCALIPPIEYRDVAEMRAASLASILNVGWIALLTAIDQLPLTAGRFGDDTAKKMERLHELLLKAVELSEARRLWEENQ